MLNSPFKFSNPYPFYTEKREKTPIYQDDNGTWYLTRYQDVVLLLSDPRFQRKPLTSTGYVNINSTVTLLDTIISKWTLFTDPPEHERLREMLSHFINPRFIKNTKEIIESVVDSLIATLITGTEQDFMQVIAYPLPIRVMNKLLGTSLDIDTVRKWSLAIATAMDHGSEEELESTHSICITMQRYFKELVLDRAAQPKEDWISELVALKQQYDLSMDDIVSNCIFILLAGNETLQMTLGLGLIALSKHPDQLHLLQNNLHLIPSAVDEMLRFDSPWTKLSRWTHEQIMIDNVMIPSNQLVVGLVNAANRDPQRFPNPDVFDITRKNNRNLAFGYGVHHCHGALLARMELQLLFTKLAPLLNRITVLDSQIEWQPNTSFRYISKLMIRIHHE